MNTFIKYIFLTIILVTLSSCTQYHEKQEDKIITDLNDIFDPNREGDTDWNYTEIDPEWMEEEGLYLDYNIGAYRQKQSHQKHNEGSAHKPMNPITSYLILFGIVYLLFNLWILYATYHLAYNKHRIIWLWILNNLIGGVSTFIILALSHKVPYDEKLNIREQTDLLGITIAIGNLMFILSLYVLFKIYILIYNNPSVLKDFLGI